MTKKNDRHIIAIGASAGGIDALEVFFKNTPIDDVPYVIVQHLSEDFKSHLTDLLSKHSLLEVCEAAQGMAVETNKVYVIPSKQYMTIANGHLQLTEKQKKDSPHKTINAFFISLAKDLGDKAIGIIMSGTGNDGVAGVEAIKEAGGLVIVQEPSTAAYSDMPANAIASEMVDVILAPEAMPKAIADYVNKIPWGFPVLSTTPPDNIHNLQPIIEYVKNHHPIDFSDYKLTTLSRRVARRMAANEFDTSEDYLAYIKTNKEELVLLTNDFLISVTSFFRDDTTFQLLKTKIIPALLEKTETELRVWVAGCATGEEAYSLAILVREYLDRHKKDISVKIFATDVDKEALNTGSKGIYSKEEVKNVSAARLKRFFVKRGAKYQVKQDLRAMLIFAYHDLVKNPPYCQMDLISCRNVLIYMNPVLQKKIHALLHFGLKTYGYLVIGLSENVESMKPYFSEISRKLGVYQKKDARYSPNFETFTAYSPREKFDLPVLKAAADVPKEVNVRADDICELLLADFKYSGVCTDAHLKVAHRFGNVNKFLLPKILTLNLKELLPDALAVAVANASKKALKINAKVAVRSIPVATGDAVTLMDLVVKPFKNRSNNENALLILFREQTDGEVDVNQIEQFDFHQQSEELMEKTEEELKELRERLAEAYERIEAGNESLQSFNEELLSANEELQSANEEMQSANEEMQSVNEELQTVNGERRQKIKELTELNDDLDNYFRSNLNGQIFVNKKLVIKKFSPSSTTYLNLQETDIGRPISHLTTNFKFETIQEDIKTAIAEGVVITKEVQSNQGAWFQVRVMPFIRLESNKIDGAIISFNDINVLKNTQEELALSNQSLLRINDDLHNFVYAASHDLTGPLANIEMTVDVLKTTLQDQGHQVKHAMDILKNSVTKFRGVINELSDIAKIEGEIVNKPDPIPMEKLLEEVRLSVLDNIVESDTVIRTKLDVKKIRFSRKNMRSILYNLITNAIKFKHPDRSPVIEIKTQDVPNFILLSISDNGSGMESRQLEKIFKMYHRLSSKVEGTGIGLYLVKKIIDSYGGKVEIDSEPGKGTTFRLYFKK